MHNMICIPGGLVFIGSPEDHLDLLPELQHFDRVWFEDEAPQHDRIIHTFWIDTYPVTNAQFAEFVAATNYVTAAEQRGYGLVYGLRYWQKEPGACWRRPGGVTDSIAQRPDHPVVHVDHDDAASYARWAGKRLPTEAEWEYAAHGPRWTSWPWGNAWAADPGQHRRTLGWQSCQGLQRLANLVAPALSTVWDSSCHQSGRQVLSCG